MGHILYSKLSKDCIERIDRISREETSYPAYWFFTNPDIQEGRCIRKGVVEMPLCEIMADRLLR